ncbi:MAG TPA: hypothetical protein VL989_01505 [Candidatus Sulfotelmatobacter sp.]|nr:hypothetical protein [Candidatus Sulfotelmatobacter sp.]
MQETEISVIRDKALKCHNNGVKWHFHILTPACSLNDNQKYAFVFECPTQGIALVHYSKQAEKTLGQELSPLLHGSKVLNQESTDSDYQPSDTVNKIINRAKVLNKQGVEWHHHMLFPDCRFNKHSPRFTLVFEDPQSNETLESLTDIEPTNDLKQIESLFYKK